MENREPNKGEMINEVDKAMSDLADEVLEAVAGGTGGDDWTSFDCIVCFPPNCSDPDSRIKLLYDSLSSNRDISRLEMYPVGGNPGNYWLVITPVRYRRESVYKEFDHLVDTIAGGHVYDKGIL